MIALEPPPCRPCCRCCKYGDLGFHASNSRSTIIIAGTVAVHFARKKVFRRNNRRAVAMTSRRICICVVWRHQQYYTKQHGALAAEQKGALKGAVVKGTLIFQPKDIMRRIGTVCGSTAVCVPGEAQRVALTNGSIRKRALRTPRDINDLRGVGVGAHSRV